MNVCTLDFQARDALYKQVINDPFLRNQIPEYLHAFSDGWHHNDALRVTAVGESRERPQAWVFDVGASFEQDWVRLTWVISSQKQLNWNQLADAVRSHLHGLGVRFLRWTLPHTITSKAQRIFESFGAIPVGWDDDDFVTYSWSLDHPNHAYTTRRHYTISNPRIEDFKQFQMWFDDNELEQAISIRRLLNRRSLKENLYNPTVGASYFAPFSILPIRKNEELVGFAVEHSWDFSFDSFREFDIALPKMSNVSIRTVPDLYCSLIDRVFKRGASRVMTASRIGASENGYPILYKHIGGTDITQAVLGFGLGDTDRRYYATYQDTFYQSRLGKPFLKHQPYERQ